MKKPTIADDWTSLHRTGKCRDEDHRLIVAQELERGLPVEPVERKEWYAQQRTWYQEWREAIDHHQWSFQDGTCSHCRSPGLMITAANRSICLDRCLNTVIPWYPTGHCTGKRIDFLLHEQSCMSHWSSQTLSYTGYLEMRLGSSNPWDGMGQSNFTSSSSVPTPNPKNSSTASPSQPSASSRPKLRPFSIPKR